VVEVDSVLGEMTRGMLLLKSVEAWGSIGILEMGRDVLVQNWECLTNLTLI
jgi:hypothetical protein